MNAAKDHPAAFSAAPWFVVGLVAALISGTVAWINCNLITIASDQFLNWENLHVQNSASANRLHKWALGLAIVAIVAGVVSLVSFPIGNPRQASDHPNDAGSVSVRRHRASP